MICGLGGRQVGSHGLQQVVQASIRQGLSVAQQSDAAKRRFGQFHICLFLSSAKPRGMSNTRQPKGILKKPKPPHEPMLDDDKYETHARLWGRGLTYTL